MTVAMPPPGNGLRDLLGEIARTGLPACVFRRAETLAAALSGRGDVDLLVPPDLHDDFAGLAAACGGVRTLVHPHHDNRSPGREDWLFLSADGARAVRLDLHAGVRAGPRHAKHIPAMRFPDPAAIVTLDTPAGPVPVGPAGFEAAAEIVRGAFLLRPALLPPGRAIALRAPARWGARQGPLRLDLAEALGLARPLVVTPALGRGAMLVAAGELLGVRGALLERSALGPGALFGQRARSGRSRALYRLSRLAERAGLPALPRRQPRAGGLVVRLAGPDDACATQAAMLAEALGASLSVTPLMARHRLGQAARLARRGHVAIVRQDPDAPDAPPARSVTIDLSRPPGSRDRPQQAPPGPAGQAGALPPESRRVLAAVWSRL